MKKLLALLVLPFCFLIFGAASCGEVAADILVDSLVECVYEMTLSIHDNCNDPYYMDALTVETNTPSENAPVAEEDVLQKPDAAVSAENVEVSEEVTEEDPLLETQSPELPQLPQKHPLNTIRPAH